MYATPTVMKVAHQCSSHGNHLTVYIVVAPSNHSGSSQDVLSISVKFISSFTLEVWEVYLIYLANIHLIYLANGHNE